MLGRSILGTTQHFIEVRFDFGSSCKYIFWMKLIIIQLENYVI